MVVSIHYLKMYSHNPIPIQTCGVHLLDECSETICFWDMLVKFWPSIGQKNYSNCVKMVVSDHYLKKCSCNSIQTCCVHLLCECSGLICFRATLTKFLPSSGVTARFVTRFNLWLRHDLWPHDASICDPARFVTKSASICDQRYTMILESKLCRGKLVFVFKLIMYTKWYNMIIYIWIMI